MNRKSPVIKAESSLSDPDVITKGLLSFDPTEPDKPVLDVPNDLPISRNVEDVTTASISVNQPSKPASQLLREFLEANSIELTVSTLTEGIKTVSDGSIILSNPKIIVNYKNN